MSFGVFAGYEPEGYDSEDFESRSPLLTPLPYTRPESEPESEPETLDCTASPPPKAGTVDPALAVVIHHLGPNNPELARIDANPFESSPEASSRRSSDMTDHYHGGQAIGVTCARPELPPLAESVHIPRRSSSSSGRPIDGVVDARALGAKAAAAVRESEANARSQSSPYDEEAPHTRVDSAQEQVEQAPPDRPASPSDRNAALRLKTTLPPPPGLSDPLSDSLSRHAISPPRESVGPLPSLQHSPTLRDVHVDTISPTLNRLPSIRQLTATVPLDQLAEVATQQDPVPPPLGRHHSQSIGSAGAPTSYYPYPMGVHGSPSPSTYHALSARSPTSTISEPHRAYGSPTFPCPSAAYFFNHRRPSSRADHNTPSGPPSLPSASSTGSMNTQTSSSTEGGGYSTHHTTPLDSTPSLPDALSRPTLPPPPGMILPSFRCDWPGCNAPPFQTQYLLSSHRNVHSQNRPYYCPRADCPRSEGGKGFKRKNEMIRHGLVHTSPGYACPFCPQREHRYPRPDNLLRHVNVHHSERERNDPRLSAVLDQRREGGGKARRRRTATGGSYPSPVAAAPSEHDVRTKVEDAGEDTDGTLHGGVHLHPVERVGMDLDHDGGDDKGREFIDRDRSGSGGGIGDVRIWGNVAKGGGRERGGGSGSDKAGGAQVSVVSLGLS